MDIPLSIEGAVPSAGNDVTPRVIYAECYCGQVEAFSETAGLPAGWRHMAGRRVQCPDCSAGERAELIPAKPMIGGHHGCRLIHNIVGKDAVVLCIHAGARPIHGAADCPIMFLARADDLRELITHLQAIVTSLKQGVK